MSTDAQGVGSLDAANQTSSTNPELSAAASDIGQSSAGAVGVEASAQSGGVSVSTPDTGRAAGAVADPGYTSIRDAARQFGVDLGGFPDDQAALQYMVSSFQQAQQLQHLAQYGQQYLQHASQFQQWLQQQRSDQRPEPAGKNPFGLPEYDQNWLRLLEKDPVTGKVTGPPDILEKVRQYQLAKESVEEKFWNDPQSFLGPMIQDSVQKQAREIAQAQLGQYQDQQFAQQFVSQNAGWIYQQNGGQPVRDPMTGQPILSDQGRRFQQYVEASERAGVRDVRAQQEFALAAVQRDYALQALQQLQSQSRRDQSNQQLLSGQAGAFRQPQRPAAANQANADLSQQNLPLRERLRMALKHQGITDQDVANAR